MRISASKTESGFWPWFLSVGFIACTVLLSAGPVHGQTFHIFFQCNDSGTNLNQADFGHESQPNWGGVISYLESAQRDMAQDGSSVGSFQHAGVTIVKHLSRSSPLYMHALNQVTTLDDCTFRFYGDEGSGYGLLYTVELTSPKVHLIEIQGSGDKILEEITFHAPSVRRTYEPAGISSQQNLSAPP
jgi:type VI secretion system Hcp family effector